jgi:hypothetical protein
MIFAAVTLEAIHLPSAPGVEEEKRRKTDALGAEAGSKVRRDLGFTSFPSPVFIAL